MSSPSTKTVANSSKLQRTFDDFIPKPLHHPNNKKCIIITTQCNDRKKTPGIYSYNVQTNESQIIYKYDHTFKGKFHGQFIDTSNNTLILYGGSSHIFNTFDLNTNQM
eukprot:429331_1